MRIVFIGAGNVATHLATGLYAKGLEIIQIYSRTEKPAEVLARKVNAGYTTDFDEVYKDADVYIYAVSDDALPGITSALKVNDTLHIHTSGSTSMGVFSGNYENAGVLYPLQTFSKNKEIDFCKIPFFIEGTDEDITSKIKELASRLSDKVFVADSEKRKKLHLSAVFACNFVNHMYEIASELVDEAGFPFDVLRPLIEETAEKINVLTPYEAQTGPAVRYDRKIIESHLEALAGKRDLSDLYDIISEDIFFTHKKENKI